MSRLSKSALPPKESDSGRIRAVRRRAFLRIVPAALAAGWTLSPAPGAPRTGPSGFSQAPLSVESGSSVHRFTVELALSPRQQAQGLMFRRRLAADAGMLFVYPTPRIITMWMRNTYIPLDMMFIGPDGRIVRIAERTRPMSTETISSGRPALAVLEVNAGTAARLGIRSGDRVIAEGLGGSAP